LPEREIGRRRPFATAGMPGAPRPLRPVFAGALALGAWALISASSATAEQRDDPLVIEGSRLEALTGIDPQRLVAFKYRRTRNRRHERWIQVPVQVDERRFVDFGQVPSTNSAPGSEGTVYGGDPIGHGAVQYTDPNTWVGPDTDPTLDPDDEVALMSGDAGDRSRRHGRGLRPRHVRGKGATRVKLIDPLGGSARFLYLYEARRGGATPAGAPDYVSYEFSLDSGEYRSTYRRRTGPNPEHSLISTSEYRAGFSDRWFFDDLAVTGGGASGAELLDGYKFSFGPTTCQRSEATFNAAEGAFVANLDGPVRAIRSYVGANSGPLTERTHVFYRDRHEIVTDLRVHAVPGPLLYHDLGSGGIGMTYFNSVNRQGVVVDGVPDQLSAELPAWHLWSGPQGALISVDRIEGTFAETLLEQASAWYLDDSTPAPNLQCWGDDRALGQAGIRSSAGMPSTDPAIGGTERLHAVTTELLAGPATGPAEADLASERLDAPLATALKVLKR